MYQENILTDQQELLQKLLSQSIDQQQPTNGPENILENQQGDGNNYGGTPWMTLDEVQGPCNPIQENVTGITPSAESNWHIQALPLVILKDQDGSEVKGYGIEKFSDGEYEAVDKARQISMFYRIAETPEVLNLGTTSRYQQILKFISDDNQLVVFFPEHPLPIGTRLTHGNFSMTLSIGHLNEDQIDWQEKNMNNSTTTENQLTCEEMPCVITQQTQAQPSTSGGKYKKRKRSTGGQSKKKRRVVSDADATTEEDTDDEADGLKQLSSVEEATSMEIDLKDNKEGHKILLKKLIKLLKKKCNSPNQAAALLLNKILMTPALRSKFNWAGQGDDKFGLNVLFPAITKIIIGAIREGWSPMKIPTDRQIEDIIKDKLKQKIYVKKGGKK